MNNLIINEDCKKLYGKLNSFVTKVINRDVPNKVYPIGSIYMSVNSTNPSELFGGTWERIQDRFLLASGSAYTNGSIGGSANAVVVKHNHTQNPHNHTQNAHYHNANSDGTRSFLTAPTGSSWNEVQGSNISGSGFHYVATPDKSNYNVWANQSANATATNKEATATNKEAGEDGTGKNMPPYLAVYMWQRIA